MGVHGHQEGAMPQAPAASTTAPPVNWAVACILVLVAEHLFALATPPYGLGVPQLFHLTFGSLYAWLAATVHAGKGWALLLLTALLATQSIGRVPVYLAEDRRSARLLRALLVAGFAVTLVAMGLLWLPRSSREYFG
jgi:hypothetical protein